MRRQMKNDWKMHAGSLIDQGVLTKEQERELRMYITKVGRIGEGSAQQDILQQIGKLVRAGAQEAE